MADFTELNASIDRIAEQATVTEGVADSALIVINGLAAQIQKAVADALAADNAADETSARSASAAIEGVRARFATKTQQIAEALVANQA